MLWKAEKASGNYWHVFMMASSTGSEGIGLCELSSGHKEAEVDTGWDS